MGTYHNIPTSDTSPAENLSPLKQLLRRLEASDLEEAQKILEDKKAAEFFAFETGRKMWDFMLQPGMEVGTGISLADMGLDSLMAIELRWWLRHAIGLQITVREIMATISLAQFGNLIAAGLMKKIDNERKQANPV
jgi:aryl carrier-like protein